MDHVYKISEIKSLGDFITYLNDHHDSDDLLFRGQSDDSPLIPKLGRIRLAGLYSEKEMFNEFVRHLPSYISQVPTSPWELLAIAQHHGMATRYLDWSSNPLAALWFAVERPFQRWGRRIAIKGEKDHGVVWVLKYRKAQFVTLKDKNPFRIKQIKIYSPPLIAARILAQAGFFTVHPPDNNKHFSPLEEDEVYAKQLTKIIVPAEAFAGIRRSMDRCGFNAATMMVDLDGAACHIAWQHSLLEDEEDDTAEKTVQKFIKENPKVHIYRG